MPAAASGASSIAYQPGPSRQRLNFRRSWPVGWSSMAKAVGFYGEDVSQPAEVIPALKRAFEENATGRPAFLEFLCSHHPVHGGWVRPA